MKERGVCIHYQYEAGWDLGKECDFWGHCQTCPKGKKKPVSLPPRPDTRRKKLDKARKRDEGC